MIIWVAIFGLGLATDALGYPGGHNDELVANASRKSVHSKHVRLMIGYKSRDLKPESTTQTNNLESNATIQKAEKFDTNTTNQKVKTLESNLTTRNHEKSVLTSVMKAKREIWADHPVKTTPDRCPLGCKATKKRHIFTTRSAEQEYPAHNLRHGKFIKKRNFYGPRFAEQEYQAHNHKVGKSIKKRHVYNTRLAQQAYPAHNLRRGKSIKKRNFHSPRFAEQEYPAYNHKIDKLIKKRHVFSLAELIDPTNESTKARLKRTKRRSREGSLDFSNEDRRWFARKYIRGLNRAESNAKRRREEAKGRKLTSYK